MRIEHIYIDAKVKKLSETQTYTVKRIYLYNTLHTQGSYIRGKLFICT